jgi:3'(2'), 5'-bisphosphate nucleotidase
MDDIRVLSGHVMQIAQDAAREILAVYSRQDPGVSFKADDSPLTEADTRAHQLIEARLRALTPKIPVLSEESDTLAWAERRRWQRFWLVDPLDGTKEFISRNGEFTVNIALVEEGVPILGVVHVPVSGVSYTGVAMTGQRWAVRQQGNEAPDPIHAAALPGRSLLRVVASRRHGGEALERLLQGLKAHFAEIELVNLGSSLKICLLAEGKADLYPRLAPTSEWDTAAAHAVLTGAGGRVCTLEFDELVYNTKSDLLNPSFLAIADVGMDWESLLKGLLADRQP